VSKFSVRRNVFHGSLLLTRYAWTEAPFDTLDVRFFYRGCINPVDSLNQTLFLCLTTARSGTQD
jgi:hypothetical protein